MKSIVDAPLTNREPSVVASHGYDDERVVRPTPLHTRVASPVEIPRSAVVEGAVHGEGDEHLVRVRVQRHPVAAFAARVVTGGVIAGPTLESDEERDFVLVPGGCI